MQPTVKPTIGLIGLIARGPLIKADSRQLSDVPEDRAHLSGLGGVERKDGSRIQDLPGPAGNGGRCKAVAKGVAPDEVPGDAAADQRVKVIEAAEGALGDLRDGGHWG